MNYHVYQQQSTHIMYQLQSFGSCGFGFLLEKERTLNNKTEDISPYCEKRWDELKKQFVLILNDEGNKELNRWMKEESSPFSLICKPYRKIYSMALKNMSTDEINQASSIALWKALLKFDPKKGKLSTFLTNKVLGEITKSLKEMELFDCKKTKAGISSCQLSIFKSKFQHNMAVDKQESTENKIIEQESLEAINNQIKDLPEKEKEVVENRIFYNKNWTEIGKIQGVTGQASSKKFDKIFRKIKEKVH